MASAALSCIALLTLVLLPVALYLAARLRPLVSIAETHSSLCAVALPPTLMACYILGRPPLIRPWLSLGLLALVQSGGVSLAVLVLHRLFLRRVALMMVPAVPELPTAAELAETRRHSAFAGCAARALLTEVPALPDDEAPNQRLQPHAERQRRYRAPLGGAVLLTLLLFACARPSRPSKRSPPCWLVSSLDSFDPCSMRTWLVQHVGDAALDVIGLGCGDGSWPQKERGLQRNSARRARRPYGPRCAMMRRPHGRRTTTIKGFGSGKTSHQAEQADVGVQTLMSTNHLPNSGRRRSCPSTAAMALAVNVTPFL